MTALSERGTRAPQHIDQLERMGVECAGAQAGRGLSVFLKHRGSEFDTVHILGVGTAFHVLADVRRWAPQTKVVVQLMLADFRPGIELRQSDVAGRAATSAVRARTLNATSVVDLALSLTSRKQALATRGGLSWRHAAPDPVVVDVAVSVDPWAARDGIAYVSCVGGQPDCRAVDYLCAEVMPLLRAQHAGATPIRLHVYASVPDAMVGRFTASDVVFHGPATRHAEAFGAHRGLVTPGGSDPIPQSRIADALGHGIPQILPWAALDGTSLENGREVLVADQPQEWADHVATLCRDETAWRALSEASLQYARPHFSFEHGQELMAAALELPGLRLAPSPEALVVRYAQPEWTI